MICDYNIVAIYTILSKVIPTPPLPPVIQNDFWMPPTRVVSLIVPHWNTSSAVVLVMVYPVVKISFKQ